MDKLVSVIIPAYNSREHIAEAVQSALDQTYQPVEVIAIDDGSTDGTGEVLRSFGNKIRYIRKENGGPASARNVGIESAAGEFVAFLDGDDIWYPQKLEKQMSLFQGDVGLVYARVDSFDENGPVEKVRKPLIRGEVFERLFNKNLISTSTVVVKKECFDKVGLFDEDPDLISVEDYDMWLRIAALTKVDFLDEPLIKYRLHPGGISKNYHRSYNGEMKVLTKNLANVSGKYPRLKQEIRGRFAKLFYEFGYDLFAAGALSEARAEFKKSIQYNPLNARVWGYYVSCFLGPKFINTVRKIAVIARSPEGTTKQS